MSWCFDVLMFWCLDALMPWCLDVLIVVCWYNKQKHLFRRIHQVLASGWSTTNGCRTAMPSTRIIAWWPSWIFFINRILCRKCSVLLTMETAVLLYIPGTEESGPAKLTHLAHHGRILIREVISLDYKLGLLVSIFKKSFLGKSFAKCLQEFLLKQEPPGQRCKNVFLSQKSVRLGNPRKQQKQIYSSVWLANWLSRRQSDALFHPCHF